eukprot:XP_001708513.1 Hypothetical protein GL50803_8562 [Giardia lamblia ATCC 50803]
MSSCILLTLPINRRLPFAIRQHNPLKNPPLKYYNNKLFFYQQKAGSVT